MPAATAGLAIGGALANTIDRDLHGAVQDFFLVGNVVVNLADVAVATALTISGNGGRECNTDVKTVPEP